MKDTFGLIVNMPMERPEACASPFAHKIARSGVSSGMRDELTPWR
jgi:hypothetical protein